MANEIFQDKVRDYLKNNGIKHVYFASKINVSPPMLSMWLRGKAFFNRSTIEKIESIVNQDNK